MCGINGIIAYNNISSEDIEVVRKTNKQLNHRGPDAHGIFKDDSIVFGNNRLSVTDLSKKANQPMVSFDGNIIVVFNGEIYNHIEVRKQLEGEYNFKTDHSDTEVILYAYKKWGLKKSLELFNGMFAFAIYDKEKQKTFLVRDRLGEKPLYYYSLNNKTYFASEAHALFANNNLKKELNVESVYHYLTFLTVKAPLTFFKNIYKLEPGHYLELNKGGIEKIEYWNIANYINQNCDDIYQVSLNKTQKRLEHSMKIRNNSDAQTSLALSGGLDSSLNMFYSSKLNNAVDAINLSYDNSNDFNESLQAKKYTEELRINFNSVKIKKEELSDSLLELFSIQKDMPFGDPSSVLLFQISKKAKTNGSKVLLVGEGGDEIGGYQVYLKIQKEYNLLKKFPKSILNTLKYLPLKKPIDFFYEENIISRRQIHGFTEFEKTKFWKKEKFNSYKVLNNLMSEIRDDLDDSFLRKVLNIEYKLRLPELILARIDYPTMAASIEARSPFMDHKLIEYSASVPFKSKLKNGPKSIIKDIAKDHLPDYILNGEKIGFGMLLEPFLKEKLPEWYKDEILSQDAPVTKLIEGVFLQKLYDKHKKGYKHGYRLWIIYALNKWMKLNNF